MLEEELVVNGRREHVRVLLDIEGYPRALEGLEVPESVRNVHRQ